MLPGARIEAVKQRAGFLNAPSDSAPRSRPEGALSGLANMISKAARRVANDTAALRYERAGGDVRAVKSAWLRVQNEAAYVRMLLAAKRLTDAIEPPLLAPSDSAPRSWPEGAGITKYNPYHDELGRFTTADGAGGGGSLTGDQRPKLG